MVRVDQWFTGSSSSVVRAVKLFMQFSGSCSLVQFSGSSSSVVHAVQWFVQFSSSVVRAVQ